MTGPAIVGLRNRAPRPATAAAENLLYYGDNLEILRQYVPDASVDLVYLDPPFNSNASYNLIFAEHDSTRAAAQIKAFGDTWHWDIASALAYEEFVVTGSDRASRTMQAFRTILGESDMLAYLSMMAPRLVELYRVLKSTGSLYLHCDPTASHYLKVLLDGVFGKENFKSEIIWKRYGSHNDSKTYGAVHDTILFYTKGSGFLFNKQHEQHSDSYVKARFKYSDPDGRKWAEQNLSSPNPRPNLTYSFMARNGIIYESPKNGWKCSRDRMQKLDDEGRLHYPAKKGGRLRLKSYQDELPGVPVQDIWVDVGAIGGNSQERLGYPTQKPEALLERIIRASSSEGDTVLDPFCGCGTAVSVSQRLGRRWIGIDITHLAISLIKARLRDTYGLGVIKSYKTIGEPVSLYGAANLAEEDRYQFQFWALGLIGARPTPEDQKKGADRGIDGRLRFHDDESNGKTKQIIISVKSGKVDVAQVRDLRGVIEREKAEIGVFITLNDPTGPMKTEAASAGFYASPWGTKHPRLQVLTVAELLDGRTIDMPPSRDLRTFKKAPKAKKVTEEGPELMFGPDDT